MEGSGSFANYNPAKQLSEQITLKNIVTHDVAMTLARTGVPELPSKNPLTFNQRMMNRVEGLNQVISAQQSLVTNNSAAVEDNSKSEWDKRNKSDDDNSKNKFEDDDNDYNELMYIEDFLDKSEQQIIKAKKTRMPEDDYVVENQNNNGDAVLELTKNFFKLMKKLTLSYKGINIILLRNKIVSSGKTIDEELTYKEQEKLFIERVTEA